jgi:hypothetical protein
VVEDETGETVKALLYRGTPDNPAFWTRALLDLPFAAGMMVVCFMPLFFRALDRASLIIMVLRFRVSS